MVSYLYQPDGFFNILASVDKEKELTLLFEEQKRLNLFIWQAIRKGLWAAAGKRQ